MTLSGGKTDKPTKRLAPWANKALPDVLETAAQDYVNWARKHLTALEKRTAIKAPLYHYTDASGLKSIIENDEIWFTDYRFLNDPSELRHGIFLAHETINATLLKAKASNADFRDRAGSEPRSTGSFGNRWHGW